MAHRYPDHSLARLNARLVICAQPTIAVESAQRALHNPLRGQDDKTLGRGRPGNNLQGHWVMHSPGLHPSHETARLGLIGPDAASPGERLPEAHQQMLRPRTILHVGGRYDHHQEQAERVDEERPLAAVDLGVRIQAADPPVSVVLTDWLAMLPARGWRCLPVATRLSPRRRAWRSGHEPSCFQSQQ
jgi:hypothetical protein